MDIVINSGTAKPFGYVQEVTLSGVVNTSGSPVPYHYFRSSAGYNTLLKICAHLGAPSTAASTLLSLNKGIRLKNGSYLRSARAVLPNNTSVRLPNWMNLQPLAFSVALQDSTPVTVQDGYAMLDVVDRPGKIGYSRFLGYDPIQLQLPVMFDNYMAFDGAPVEKAIAVLERMAGRGQFTNAGRMPPQPLRAYATNAQGQNVWVVPQAYQYTSSNKTAPLFVVEQIQWAGDDLRDDMGQRVRASATITLQEYTPLTMFTPSASQRAKLASAPDQATGSKK